MDSGYIFSFQLSMIAKIMIASVIATGLFLLVIFVFIKREERREFLTFGKALLYPVIALLMLITYFKTASTKEWIETDIALNISGATFIVSLFEGITNGMDFCEKRKKKRQDSEEPFYNNNNKNKENQGGCYEELRIYEKSRRVYSGDIPCCFGDGNDVIRGSSGYDPHGFDHGDDAK